MLRDPFRGCLPPNKVTLKQLPFREKQKRKIKGKIKCILPEKNKFKITCNFF